MNPIDNNLVLHVLAKSYQSLAYEADEYEKSIEKHKQDPENINIESHNNAVTNWRRASAQKFNTLSIARELGITEATLKMHFITQN